MAGGNQYNRPGTRYYVNAATAQLNHGDPCIADGVVGIAQKQKQPSSTAALSSYTVIAVGEPFVIICKGVVRTAMVTGAVKGSPIYITSAGALTLTAAGNTKYGRVVEIAGQRGTASGYMRVDLDMKDSF